MITLGRHNCNLIVNAMLAEAKLCLSPAPTRSIDPIRAIDCLYNASWALSGDRWHCPTTEALKTAIDTAMQTLRGGVTPRSSAFVALTHLQAIDSNFPDWEAKEDAWIEAQ